ncbi:MAG: nucleotidyltransferase family protein [Nitrososphaerota archaeon]|jgi:molybdenum cofactor cytidylyltransferase|nr:nucleotidyltransferase family protein [Nitrososphaerota archaeon]MDG6927241.1 nucleotidyltransferase family protein [Nitrososphaerota archaeon]MDG6930401.1 nucleotidyltransferase family protein [Nitrososphaerota archaeon]MDG6932608.1 nucleotidyltransferase family protein [Nitrososphaerota archaeon]MDG6935654.1 nucleotidyltransferase family protein [Nitrososphaerota archaeon]
MDYDLIILAAGESTRFGENKLIYRINGIPIIRRVTTEALLPNVRVMVVIGHDPNKIREALEGINVNYIYNPDYKKGMSQSIIAGVKLSNSDKGILILPGDMAYIKSHIIEQVIEAHMRTGANIVIPTYNGRGGHPILFDVKLKNELLFIKEETRGLKEIVQRHENEAYKIEVGTPTIVHDVDIKGDLNFDG